LTFKLFPLNINPGFSRRAFQMQILRRYVGVREYFRDPWNQFDFTLVMAGYSGFLTTGGGAENTVGLCRLNQDDP
jgi:hypothetical protein